MSSFKLFLLSLLVLAAIGIAVAVVLVPSGMFASHSVNAVMQALP
jgi:hypothetical protein